MNDDSDDKVKEEDGDDEDDDDEVGVEGWLGNVKSFDAGLSN